MTASTAEIVVDLRSARNGARRLSRATVLLNPGLDNLEVPQLPALLDGLSDLTREIQEGEARLAHAKRRRGLLLTALRECYGDDAWMQALDGLGMSLETARGEMWVARRVPEGCWELGFSYSALKAAAALPPPDLEPTLRLLQGLGRTTVAAVNAELRERALLAAPPPADPAAGPLPLTEWLRSYALREWAGRFGPDTAQEIADGFAAEVLEWSKVNGLGGRTPRGPAWYTGP